MLRGSLVPVFTLDFAWSASNLIHHYRVAATVGSNPTVTVVSFCHLVFHPTWGDGQWNGLIGYCEVVGSKMPPKSPRQPWFDRFLGEVVFAMWMAKLTIQTFFGRGDPTIQDWPYPKKGYLPTYVWASRCLPNHAIIHTYTTYIYIILLFLYILLYIIHYIYIYINYIYIYIYQLYIYIVYINY